MSAGRVLEKDSLLKSIKSRADKYRTLEGNFITLKTAFQTIVDLDDFRGMGAKAIKNFYQAQIDVVDAWLLLIEMQIIFLDDVPNILKDYELDEEKFIQSDFLENDLKTAHKQVKTMVMDQQENQKAILDSISDILSLQAFSLEKFHDNMKRTDGKREEMVELLEGFDEGLSGEYSQSIPAQESVYALLSELLNATAQGGEIQPINFDAHAFQNSEAHQVKKEAVEVKDAYLAYKDEQQVVREKIAEAERLENMEWYEKLWHHGSVFVGEVTGYYDAVRASTGVDPVTGEELSAADRAKHGAFAAAGFIPFVGWAGRAIKGGKAIYSTTKGMKAIDSSLSAYQYAKSLDNLRKAEYGIYGLASANGFSEYITGKDMFGNELSEEKREQSLYEALFVLGVSGAGVYVDRLQAGNALYSPGTKVSKVNANGHFNFESTKHMKGFKDQIHHYLNRHDLSIKQFNNLRLKPVSELTDAEVNIMKDLRDSVPPVTEETLLQKTIPISDVEKYLSGEYTEIGGYVSKVEDVSDVRMYDDVVESLRLDYVTWDGTMPYPKDGDSYGIIRFNTNKVEEIEIPYGERFGGSNTDGPPCTLNGFTGARNGQIIPEWGFKDRNKPVVGAELFQVKNGNETLLAVFDGKAFIKVD